jgi:type IV pilus assembly protein PilQ
MSFRMIANHVAAAGLVTVLALVAEPLLAQDGGAAIERAQVQVDGAATELTVVLAAAPSSVPSHFLIDGGQVLVVDIPGGVVDGAPQVAAAGLVERVEMAQSADGRTATLRAYLTEQIQDSDVELGWDGAVVTVRIEAAQVRDPLRPDAAVAAGGKLKDQGDRGRRVDSVSGPTDSGGRTLSSLDFENLDSVSRIVIGTSSVSDYTSSQPQERLVVLDVPGAQLPKSLARELDTSEFISPVKRVHAYQTSTGVRVAVNLRQGTEWSVRSGPDNLIYVDFEIPETMRQDRVLANQAFTDVSPSGTENATEGLGSYSASETLIGQSGRTANPQAAFGTGVGSRDASDLAGSSLGFMFDNSSATEVPFAGRRINIDLVEADIHSVFRLISHVSRLNIVAGDDVSGTVTVRLEDVPWDQALAAVLQAKGLGAERFGNIVRVAPLETIKSEQQAALDARRAKDQLLPLSVLVVPLNYANAGDVSAQLSSMLSERGSVEADERSNQLVVRDTEGKLAQLREVLRQLDRETPQVLIEARIVEATANFGRDLGIQWGGELDASAATGYSTGLFFPSSIGVSGGQAGSGQQAAGAFYSPDNDNLAVDLPSPTGGGSLAFSLGSIPGLVNIDARLSALEAEGWGEIVSSPRITTLDNTQASISQGAQIPYLTVSAQGTSVQFVQAALSLDVTPHITSDGRIFMELVVSNNRADFAQAVQGQPAIQIKEASTELLVADGDTMVIGGVFATEESNSTSRVPLLHKIPLLGYLFRSTSISQTRNEMLVFVTPSIVTTIDRD